jgi:hypothetical protein
MTYSKRIRLAPILVALAILFVFSLATPRPTEAAIHEIIAALCHGGEITPPGQVKEGQSFVRALQATGFITSIVESATSVTINFDPTVPNSKFRDAGVGDVTIPDAIAPGVDLILSPGIEADPDFPAHAHCPLFPPGP